MPLSFAIIGPKSSENTTDLHDEINKKGHSCLIYSMGDISIDSLCANKYGFFSHDIYIFRGYNKSISFTHTLSSILNGQKKIIIDELLTKTVVRDKLQESVMMSSEKISHPHTYYAQKTKKWIDLLKNTPLPIIVKPLSGQKGQGVRKIESFSEVEYFFTENPKDFIAQEYIKSDGDIRVFIVNDKILGAIKRFAPPNDFRSNASLGARTEKYNLSEKEKCLAIDAHKCIGYDISGVDIIFNKDGESFVLEVNHTPQWQAFKKATNINPAKEIIKYSIKKYEEKNRI